MVTSVKTGGAAIPFNLASTPFGRLQLTIFLQVAGFAIACFAWACTGWANLLTQSSSVGDDAKIAGRVFSSASPVWKTERFIYAVQISDITADMGLYAPRAGNIIRSCGPETGCPFAESIELATWLGTGDPDAVSFAVVFDDIDIFTEVFQSDEPVKATASSRKLVNVATSESTAPRLVHPGKMESPSTTANAHSPAATPLPLLPLNSAPWIYALAGALLLVVVAVKHLLAMRRARAWLNVFYFQVDTIQRQFGPESKRIDDQVQMAFDKLHDGMRLLLQKKQVRLFHLKRAVMRFDAPDVPMNAKRHTLSRLGYVLAASRKFDPAAPVLALYKYTGEARASNGMVADTYAILKEGSSMVFSHSFKAKIQSPFVTTLASQINVSAANDAADATTAPVEADHNVAYILSLLGPIKLMKAHWVESNLNAIAALPQAALAPAPLVAMSAWANLRSLLTEDIRRIEPTLAAARTAMQQQPLLLIAALAEIDRYQQRDHTQLFSLLGKVATALKSSTGETHHISTQALMLAYAQVIQSLEPIAPYQRIENPGVAYVEARGAEADAGFLMRIAYLTAPTNPLANNTYRGVIVTTNLTVDGFRTQLKGYAAFKPGKEEQAVVAHLLTRLDARQLIINTVEGTSAVSAKSALARRIGKYDHCLVLSANPALVDISGVEANLSYYLWTLSGQTFHVTGENLCDLIGAARNISRARQGQNAQQPVTVLGTLTSGARHRGTQTNLLEINKSGTLTELLAPTARSTVGGAEAFTDGAEDAGENQTVRTASTRRIGAQQ